MSREIRDLLHGAAPDPSIGPDLDRIRSRGRTLVATRVAAVSSVVALAVVGAFGVVTQLTAEEDPTPPVIEQPSPTPATADPEIVDVPVCPPASYRPTYLPWLGEGEDPGEPDHVAFGDEDEPNLRATWTADREGFVPDGPHDAPVVTVAVLYETDWEPGEDGWRQVEVAGHEGELVWIGDPGVGGVSILWRERPGPCGTYSVSLLTYRLGEYVDLGVGDEPADGEEIDEWMAEGERAMEDELVRVAQSLVPWDPAADATGGCAEDGLFPEIADDEVWVFFYCDDPSAHPASLYATVRDLPDGREPLEVAMESLAAGPTDGERSDGFRATLAEMGEISVLEVFHLTDETVVIDLTGLPDELTQAQRSFLPPGFLEEIAWTVFHNDDQVDAIELRLDGSCDDFWQLLTGEECRPYTRNQWGHIPDE